MRSLGRLLYRTGLGQLTEDGDEPLLYLQRGSGKEFLNFFEDIFSAESFLSISNFNDRPIDELNHLLQLDSLPYQVIRFVKETVTDPEDRFGASSASKRPRLPALPLFASFFQLPLKRILNKPPHFLAEPN
jgi:hypothetical protein